MKNLARIALVSAALGTAANAAPFLAIGDGAELFVTGTLGVRADDNIYNTDNAISDTIFDINPGVEITFGKDAALKGSLTLVDSFANYSDNSNLNTNLFSGDLNAAYDDAKLKLKFNLGYHEQNQNAPDIRGLTRRDQFVTGANAEVEISQITSVSAGVSFDHTNYKRTSYADTDTLTVPLNFYYKWTPKIDLSVGYRFRDYETTIGRDSTDHYFSVGARGEFTPLLTGQISVGYNERDLAGGGSETLPGLEASLTYALTPKTSITVGASNDYGTAPQGAQQKNFSLNGGITTDISSEWKLNAGLSYRAIDYYTRTDDYVEGNVGATYVINTYVKITGAYVYRSNSSDLKGSEFTNNVFSISASLRY
jgi:hypothetical protein